MSAPVLSQSYLKRVEVMKGVKKTLTRTDACTAGAFALREVSSRIKAIRPEHTKEFLAMAAILMEMAWEEKEKS